MQELTLKYGLNPNQTPARLFMDAGELPLTVHSGRPGTINLLDALNGWQLVTEAKAATGLPAAASFKHVSPAGVGLGLPIGAALSKAIFTKTKDLSPLACAYARARGADRMSAFGDFIALSDPCDLSTAQLIQREVSDGVIAPGYTPEALTILKNKRKGGYAVVEINPTYVPQPLERRTVFGMTFEAGRNNLPIDKGMLQNIVTDQKTLPEAAQRDLLLALITLKYTQSNSVCYCFEGQTIGVGAGQQSRIHCTRLAGDKADKWFLRQHPAVLALPFLKGLSRPERDNAVDVFLSDTPEDVLADSVWQTLFSEKPIPISREEKRAYLAQKTGVSLGSDAFFPFGDNVIRAHRSGVSYIAEPGGSVRDDEVIKTANERDMVICMTGIRLFHH